jgi:hypothetical protein
MIGNQAIGAETALIESVITEEKEKDIDRKKEKLFKKYTEWIINTRNIEVKTIFNLRCFQR